MRWGKSWLQNKKTTNVNSSSLFHTTHASIESNWACIVSHPFFKDQGQADPCNLLFSYVYNFMYMGFRNIFPAWPMSPRSQLTWTFSKQFNCSKATKTAKGQKRPTILKLLHFYFFFNFHFIVLWNSMDYTKDI